MRVLYARVGTPYSPFTGKPIKSQTVSEMVDKILSLPTPSRVSIYSPIVRGRKGEYKKEILSLKKRGFTSVKIDETLYEIDETPNLNKKITHNIEVLVDKFINKKDEQQRIAESLESALNLSDGLVYIEYFNQNILRNIKKKKKLFL